MKVLMLNWRVMAFYLSLLSLLILSGKPLWWLPLLSLALLILSFPQTRSISTIAWHHWHPVFSSLSALSNPSAFFRWVRHKKIIGGDSLILLPMRNETGLLLLDLSKNDIDTFLHFVWARTLLTRLQGSPKSRILRLLEAIRQCGRRVELSYLLGFLTLHEAEWRAAGCFGVGWFNEATNGQQQVLPALGITFWRVRRQNAKWVFTTDGVATHLREIVGELNRNGSPESFVQSLLSQDDLTIGWFVPKLKALSAEEVAKV